MSLKVCFREVKELIKDGLEESAFEHFNVSCLPVLMEKGAIDYYYKNFEKQFIQLYAQHKKLIQADRLIISENRNQEAKRNKIRNGFLDLITDIEKKLDSENQTNSIHLDKNNGSSLFHKKNSSITITIDRDFENFSESDQQKFLHAVALLLKMDQGDITIQRIDPGSIKIVLNLPKDKILALKALIESGELSEWDIIDIEITSDDQYQEGLENSINSVIVQIMKGRIDKAIDKLLNIIEDKYPESRNDIILLSSQYQYYSKKHIGGIYSVEEFEPRLINITNTLLEIIEVLDETGRSEEAQGMNRSQPIQAIDSSDKIRKPFEIYKHTFMQDSQKRKQELRALINRDRELLNNADNQTEIEELNENTKNYIEELRHVNESEVHILRSNLEHIDFVNRLDEINMIERPAGITQYWLLDGPTGYGKTELMNVLWKKIDEEKTIGINIQIDYQDDLLSIYKKFMKSLGVFGEPDTEPLNENNFGVLLYKKLFEQYEEDLKNKGLSIFIDFEGKPSPYFSLLQDIAKKTIGDAIRRIPRFKTNPNSFRVIYAGRYLSKKALRVVRSIPLSDFNFDAITQTVTNHGGILPVDVENEIAAHIMFLTGGHPLCISKALHTLGEFGPAYLIEEQEKVYSLIDLITESIEFEFLEEEPWFFHVLQACSVFRFITLDILAGLKSLLKEFPIPNEVMIESRLKHSQLWIPAGYNNSRVALDALEDGIARRVLTIHLRQTDPEKYKKYCEFAIKCCFDGITTQNDSPSWLWLIEYFFQSLQIYAGSIDDPDARQRIKQGFYSDSGNFIKGIKAYRATILPERLQREINNIVMRIDGNSEFQFIVNYYFRDENDKYNDNPIKEFKHKLKNELNK